ncbi:MAG: pseudouridine synthase [Lewinellaceae bacterium]|nr:pseudouridine synthase [Lewinellaceae bacterium]
MEEKKRRPRIHKPDTGFSLQERPKLYRPNDESENQDENTERKKPWEDREGGQERKPWQDRNQGSDRNEGGFERKPWQDRSQGSDRPYQNREGGERKPWQDRSQGTDRPYQNREGGERKPWQDRSQGTDRPYQNREGGERKPWQDRSQGTDRPYQNREGGGERKPWQDRSQGTDRPYQNREGGGERKPWQDRSQGTDRPYQNREGGGERKPWQDRSQGTDRPYQNREGGGERRPWQDRSQGTDRPYQNREGGGDRRPFNNNRGGGGGFNKKPFGKKPFRKKEEFYIEPQPKPSLPSGEGMPLNKYLAHCGLSSRRKAVEFVEQGLVTVNGEVKKEPYYRIQAGDVVLCDGKSATVQERLVYVLLNKPKNVITTTEDDRGRNTVLDIVDPHFPERLYPVGRLDRDTTGLILITNDGDLAQKLSHPSHAVQKQYRVGLRRPLTQADFEHLERGVELEDGLMEVNWIRFSEDHPERDIVELEISSGRNRIVRRLFEHLGYEIFKLDRFYFAGLTKKELPRGAFRELTQREIIMLKHFTGHPSGGGHKEKQETAEITPEEEASETDEQV